MACCIKNNQKCNDKEAGKAVMRSNRLSTVKALMGALCLFVLPMSSQAIPMQVQQGDSFRFGIDLSTATPSGPYNYLSWYVNTNYTDGINPGDILSVALYDDADPSTTLGTDTFDWTAGPLTTLSVGSMIDANPAFDGTGFLQFTMVSGSIDLLGGMVYGISNDYTADGLTDITVIPAATVSVPEPNTLSLLGLALLLAAFTLKRTSRTQTAFIAERAAKIA
jgi:hypothetical protein